MTTALALCPVPSLVWSQTPTPTTVISPPGNPVAEVDPLPLLHDPDTNIPQETRDGAAARLLASGGDDNTSSLLNLLQSGPSASRIAVARAIALDASVPSDTFIAPLLTLLRGPNPDANPELATASAQALGKFSESSEALQGLAAVAKSDQSPVIRSPSVLALGSFDRKAAAETLIDLVQTDDSERIRDDAGNALIEMTGLNVNDHDAVKWAIWFDKAAALSETDFRAAIVTTRGQAFRNQLQHTQRLNDAMISLLGSEYRGSPPAGRSRMLFSYLRSNAPEIRSFGADLVLESRLNRDGAPPGTIHETQLLLSDPVPDVRAAAAHALSADFDSASAMVAQLAKETDDEVRIQLIKSLAPFHDRASIELMLSMVGPRQSPSLRIAAADGIRQGADVINKDPAWKDRCVQTLKAGVAETGDPGSNQRLRASLVSALSVMKEDSLLDLFRKLVFSPAEAPSVKQSALRGLGNLPDPSRASSIIAGFLTDDDPNIRIAALQALESFPKPKPDLDQQLLTRLATDPDERVKAEVWNVLQVWFQSPSIDESDLAVIAGGLKDPAKELKVRQKLADRLSVDMQNPALSAAYHQTAAEDHASQQEVIGDILLQETINRPGDAAEQYVSAYNFWKANKGKVEVLDQLCQKVVRALLAAKRWSDATAFASQAIKDYQNDPMMSVTVERVGTEFKLTARRFQDADDYSDAMDLFAAVDKMSPPLPQSLLEPLIETKNEIVNKHQSEAAGHPIP